MKMQMQQQMTLFADPSDYAMRRAAESRRDKLTQRRRDAAEARDGRGRHANSLAAHDALETALNARRAEIVAWVSLNGPCTVRQIVEGLFGAGADMNLVRPRVTELLNDDRLVEDGSVKDHVSGRPVMLVDVVVGVVL